MQKRADIVAETSNTNAQRILNRRVQKLLEGLHLSTAHSAVFHL
jgi:hypothetical protein